MGSEPDSLVKLCPVGAFENGSIFLSHFVDGNISQRWILPHLLYGHVINAEPVTDEMVINPGAPDVQFVKPAPCLDLVPRITIRYMHSSHDERAIFLTERAVTID